MMSTDTFVQAIKEAELSSQAAKRSAQIALESVTSKVEFEARTTAGFVPQKFDEIAPAKEFVIKRRAVGINLKLFQVTTITEEINV